MPAPILTTKLYIPPPRPNAVLRPRLIARLNEGLHRKLTLIAAPAGFGKTTLVSEWLASLSSELHVLSSELSQTEHTQTSKLKTQNFNVAWLSLDEGDSDPVRFLTYLVAALQMIAPTIGAELVAVLQSLQPPPIDALLPMLLNEIATLPQPAILVLDDYHVLDARPIDQALAFLVERLPPQLLLVITSREDPQLPLARLRVRDQLTELRAADLRFTPAEAAGFLTQVMGLNLAADDIAALETRTEGWIAGLQLAALSMRGREDIPGFIRAFAGDNRYVVDYLLEEVLQRQPERVRSFLLQTAILDRLNGSLCDAVTGQARGQAQLEALERGNFFVVPLDDRRHWYRYHHLFADVLRAHLMAEQPDLLATLHRRASAWYEQHGSAADAIRHALAAADFARAAGLVELAAPAMRRSRQDATLLGWLKALPDELIHYRPVLSAGYAGALLSSGELDGVEARLRDAERWLDTTAAGPARPDAPVAAMVVVDEAAFHRLPGAIAVWRAGQALARGNVPETVTHARHARGLVHEDDHLMRGAAASLLGIASWTSGDLEAAHQGYAEGMAHLQLAGHIADAVGCAIALADIRIVQGRLHEALRTYEQALQLAAAQGEPLVRGTAGLYVGVSELQRERNDLPAATQHLLRSQELGEHNGLPQHRYRWRVAMARVRAAEGDPDGALELLDEAERLYVSDFFPNLRPIAALKARVWVAQRRLGEALGWARAQGLSAQDDLSYLREFEHITLARVLLAHATSERAAHSRREVIGLLERLLQAAEAGARMGSAIETLVLLSLAHQAQGDIPAALVPLERALTLAEPEGYARVFVDEGAPLAALLGRMKDEGGRMKDYAVRLLAAFGKQEDVHPSSFIAHPLIEPLSARELDVLRLLRTDLSGPEIARELMVSLHTLRTHTNNIYTKLGINNRRAAVRRAEELDLF
ncbi:MAG: helix-turn-helix transcriptional regulator [Kouleothrix sp.]|nr:helix-turn-helix transcriptional regulator [Kouleothrix sp.]